ncbi:MAG TPA: polysaccharide deacetylase family protein [Gemmatimonadaceae bacterium]|nr:polysaccharide deacetylase family protein [Gemmatimonadaceae bacterium]
MLKVRPTAKALVEFALVTARIDRVRRALLSRRVLVLAYHNIVPDGEQSMGDRSLHLPQRQFAEQLDVLLQTHDVVPLASVFDAAGAKRRRFPRLTLRRERPRAVMTFDDGYRGALTVGLKELSARRLPATFFIAPGILGDRTMWWDAFANVTSGELDSEFRATALAACRGSSTEIAALALRRGQTMVTAPSWARTVTEAELAQVVATPGVTVGSHSWSHANLAALGEAALDEELTQSFDWLKSRFSSAFVPWLAWPYGLQNAAAAARALTQRYRGALRVTGGYFTGKQAVRPDGALPRMNVPAEMTRNAFRLRVSGVRRG